MACPTLETLAQKAGKTPDDFTHDSFTKLLVRVHASRDAPLEETVCFREPHANGKPHFNLLVRASSQYRCKNVAETLLSEHSVHVIFGEDMRTWAEGVAYGCVAAEHKGEEGLDHDYTQWHKAGCPTPVEQILPRR